MIFFGNKTYKKNFVNNTMLNSFKTIAVVPARSGSRGLPGKNFKNFDGRPLYLRAIDQALKSCDCCIFSSDNLEALAEVGNTKNVYTHERARNFAEDDTPIDATLKNIIECFNIKNKTLILLQPTSPLRSDSSIHEALNKFDRKKVDLVMGVTKTDSSILKYGFVSNDEFKAVNDPKYCFTNRQSLPAIFRPNGSIFIFNSSWLISNGSLATHNIGCIKMSEHESFDIDSYEDFMKAETLFRDRKITA